MLLLDVGIEASACARNSSTSTSSTFFLLINCATIDQLAKNM